jgi:hypothetical protein
MNGNIEACLSGRAGSVLDLRTSGSGALWGAFSVEVSQHGDDNPTGFPRPADFFFWWRLSSAATARARAPHDNRKG